MVESFDESDVVEEDYGPWEALLVLSEKPQKENVL